MTMYMFTLYQLCCLLYPLQYDCCSPLHNAASQGHTTCVEHLLYTPGIDVNIKDNVSGSIKICCCCAKEHQKRMWEGMYMTSGIV